MKRIHITHTDLDGYGCKFVGEQVFPDIETYMVDYNEFADIVLEVLAKKPDFLLISDIWSDDLTKEAWDGLAYFKGDLVIFDHHPTTEEEQSELEIHGATVVNGSGESATLKMARHYNVNLPVIEHVNTYDMSGTIEGVAGKLNAIYWEIKDNHEYLADMFSRDPFVFSATDDNLYNKLQERKAAYYEDVVKDAEMFEYHGLNCVFVEADKDQAFISKNLLNFNDLVIMSSNERGKISFRSVEPLAGKLAEALGGGGHPQAAGSRIVPREEVKRKIMEVL